MVDAGYVLPVGGLKPKFHYANFPVTSASSPRQTRDVPIHLTATSPTSQCLVADVADFPVYPTQMGWLPTVTGIFQAIWTCCDGFKTLNFPVTWSMLAASLWQVADFPTTRVTGKFQGSRCNGIRASIFKPVALVQRSASTLRCSVFITWTEWILAWW